MNMIEKIISFFKGQQLSSYLLHKRVPHCKREHGGSLNFNWTLLFASGVLFILSGCQPDSNDSAIDIEVSLMDEKSEKYVFNVNLDIDVEELEGDFFYSYRILSTAENPYLYVWSGIQPLEEDHLRFKVSKYSLIRTDDHEYQVLFQLKDASGKLLAEKQSKAFSFSKNHPDLPQRFEELPAFPGAFGAGTDTPGGRGGTIYTVDTLEDYDEDEESIEGSFRHALKQEGPRLIIFAVSGNINLKRPLEVDDKPNLTVAGNTAPFPGVTIVSTGGVQISSSHAVLRYLRFRMSVDSMWEKFERTGTENFSGWDALGAGNATHVVFDHVSASHAVDETLSFGRFDRVTNSNSIISHSISGPFHPKQNEPHNLGGLIAHFGEKNRHAMASSHGNVWAHHLRRMPGISAGRDDDSLLRSYIDVRNSVMYNWHTHAMGSEGLPYYRNNYLLNFVGNYLKPGPDTPKEKPMNITEPSTRFNVTDTPGERRMRGVRLFRNGQIYLAHNVHNDYARKKQSTDQYSFVVCDNCDRQEMQKAFRDDPAPVPYVPYSTEPKIEDIANESVGASVPARDNIDFKVIEDVRHGTGRHAKVTREEDHAPPLPELPMVRHAYYRDIEEDPFPIWWKLKQGLEAHERIHPHADSNVDGYSNIESYMHGLTLYGELADWSNPDKNHNPLAKTYGDEQETITFSGISDHAWSDDREKETIFANGTGVILMASSTQHGHPCRYVLKDSARYWSSGSPEQDDTASGPAGAQPEQGGSALVLAFPYPHRISVVELGKPDLDGFSSAYDPDYIVVQGLLGWPDVWIDLSEEKLPLFDEQTTRHRIGIPERNRGFYKAYRMVFNNKRENEVKLQSISFNFK